MADDFEFYPRSVIPKAAGTGLDEQVAEAFESVLDGRLIGLVVHGSAVTGGIIEGFSDYDFVVFTHGALTASDGIRLQFAIRDVEPAPFSYLQLSSAINVDDEESPSPLFVPGAYRVVRGVVPSASLIFTNSSLTTHARHTVREVAGWFHSDIEGWATATGDRRSYMFRLLMTRLKPSVRALLIERGELPMLVWSASYFELAEMWSAHSPTEGRRFRELVESLGSADEAVLGSTAIEVLDGILAEIGTRA
jgi:hypothetical protein